MILEFVLQRWSGFDFYKYSKIPNTFLCSFNALGLF